MPPKIPRRTVAQVALKIYANDLEALSFSLSGYGLWYTRHTTRSLIRQR